MPNVPDYMERDGEQYRFVVDQLGSVVAVVNAGTAELVQQREYDAFGRIISETTAPGFSQPFGFAGGIWDADTGLVRFGARDYGPGDRRVDSRGSAPLRGGGWIAVSVRRRRPGELLGPRWVVLRHRRRDLHTERRAVFGRDGDRREDCPDRRALAQGAQICRSVGAPLVRAAPQATRVATRLSKGEALARTFKMNFSSPTAKLILNNLGEKTSTFVGKFRKGSIRRELPSEVMDMTLEQALRHSKLVRKLLVDGRFVR